MGVGGGVGKSASAHVGPSSERRFCLEYKQQREGNNLVEKSV